MGGFLVYSPGPLTMFTLSQAAPVGFMVMEPPFGFYHRSDPRKREGFDLLGTMACDYFGISSHSLCMVSCPKIVVRIGEALNPGPHTKDPTTPSRPPPKPRDKIQVITANVVSMIDKTAWFASFDHH